MSWDVVRFVRDNWLSDAEFGRQTVAGVNPKRLRVADAVPYPFTKQAGAEGWTQELTDRLNSLAEVQ